MRFDFLPTRFCFDDDRAFVSKLLRHLIRNVLRLRIVGGGDHTEATDPHRHGAGINRAKGGKIGAD